MKTLLAVIIMVTCFAVLPANAANAVNIKSNGFNIVYTTGHGFRIVQANTVISSNSLFLCMEPGWKNHWFYDVKHKPEVKLLKNGIEVKTDPAQPSPFILDYWKITTSSPNSFTLAVKGTLAEDRRAFITNVILNLSEAIMVDAQIKIDAQVVDNKRTPPFKQCTIESRTHEIKIEVIKGNKLVIIDRTSKPYMRRKGFIVMEGKTIKIKKDDVYEQVVNIMIKKRQGVTRSAPISSIAPAKLKTSGLFGASDKNRTLNDIVRKESSYKGKFTWNDYRALLSELSKSRYKVVPLKDFAHTASTDKIVVGMRHDSDSHPEKALTMMDLEASYGLHSTYLFLHSAKYYGTVKNGVMIRNKGFDELAQEIYKAGFEVGIHTDLFTMMWKYQFDPVAFIRAEIAYYKKLGIPIIGSAAHGSSYVIRKKVNNTWIFADFGKTGSIVVDGCSYEYGKHSLAEFGLDYEGYRLKKNDYTGDIDRRLRSKPASAIVEHLANLKAPCKIIILTHPEHWGK